MAAGTIPRIERHDGSAILGILLLEPERPVPTHPGDLVGSMASLACAAGPVYIRLQSNERTTLKGG